MKVMLCKHLKLLRVCAVAWQQQAELGVEFITENHVVLHTTFSAPHIGC